MKTAKEYKGISIRYWIDFDRGNIDAKEYENRIESLFKQAQKEAYNQALNDALDNAVVETIIDERGIHRIIHKQSILKLKK